MNYIDKVTIKEFWGDKTVSLNFEKEENFLIGVNGSGKTTVINLIVSVIEANFTSLERENFDCITVYLSPRMRGGKKSRIVVSKEIHELTSYPDVLYQIYSGREKIFENYLNDIGEGRIFRGYDSDYERNIRFRKEVNHNKELRDILKNLFNTSWLSIHRASFNSRYRDERRKDSTVDIKLDEFSRSFNGYLNELNRDSRELTDEFQKYIFLSLISTESVNHIYLTLDKLNIKKEKESLAKIYSLFNINSSAYKKKLDEYIKSYELSYKKRKNETLKFDDAEVLIGMKRIHSVIQEWKELTTKQDEIFKYKNSFMSIINGLLQRKELIINETNELKVKTDSGKEFDLNFLSSGEKQLLIIFGETLLQRSEPHIFIADEPELSLHIEWQEQLVSSLKILNPYAQMIFATHSPDIVSSYQSSVINIEKCIS